MDIPVIAGSAATVVFASSTLPMLAKARRTRDVASYSAGNIVLANLGNVLYTVYVVHLPIGPVWALHAFHTLSTVLMLFWYVRYVVQRERAYEGHPQEGDRPRAQPSGDPAPLTPCACRRGIQADARSSSLG